MRCMRIAGLCLVVACAAGGFAAESASAQPEYFQEGKVITKAITFTIKSTKTPVLLGGGRMECKGGDTGKGKIAPPNKIEKLKITYTGCRSAFGGGTIPCQKSASKPEIISTESLKGVLTTASKVTGGATVVATTLTGEKSEFWAKLTCGTLKANLKGSLLTEVTPVGAESVTGFWTSNTKAESLAPGCSEQDLLFIEGAGGCVHLSGFISGGSVAFEAQDQVTYKVAKTSNGVEVHP